MLARGHKNLFTILWEGFNHRVKKVLNQIWAFQVLNRLPSTLTHPISFPLDQKQCPFLDQSVNKWEEPSNLYFCLFHSHYFFHLVNLILFTLMLFGLFLGHCCSRLRGRPKRMALNLASVFLSILHIWFAASLKDPIIYAQTGILVALCFIMDRFWRPESCDQRISNSVRSQVLLLIALIIF